MLMLLKGNMMLWLTCLMVWRLPNIHYNGGWRPWYQGCQDLQIISLLIFQKFWRRHFSPIWLPIIELIMVTVPNLLAKAAMVLKYRIVYSSICHGR